MTEKENLLRAVRFERPDSIPMVFAINAACYTHYPQDALFDLMEGHPYLFPGFERPKGVFTPEYHPIAKKGQPFTDDWGCVWETLMDGITGTVTGHPLTDLSELDRYPIPDPAQCTGIGPIDWESERAAIAAQKEAGVLVSRGLRHGHTFLQLCDILGYENLFFAMADEDKNLLRLIEKLEEFNLGIVERYVDAGVDIMGYAEDLGQQNAPMISPSLFKTYIKPSYTRLMQPAREAGIPIHMHSDGYLHELIDDIVGSGVEIINLQDLVNGIDWIRDRLAGKVCIDLDIDRQTVTARGTPDEIDALIREEVQSLSTRQGGLMMIYGLYPGVPLENV